ncbi:uncharacterized protein A4U43_C10F5840 [Asparagus officinalis]|uniref:Glutathione S-transferase n=1 Tax=Asparagus officinalis TaxID=4686 RepID=A0A5P1E451_ASPOF|nr:glutathione S-transferase U17-like isoform X2 [Asparagus officinalis]ONK56267.1 uncharacterized protein A4U43_C10F5840 [Asparagus officinalis]
MATSKIVGEDVKLLGHWASIFVVRARIALNLKGVSYEFLEEEIGSKAELVKSELLLESNPVYKKIPVLIHGGKPICESLIIVQYIDEAWDRRGPSILPYDPHDRALARFWAVYVDEWIVSFFTMLRANTEETKTEATEKTITGLRNLEEAFTKCSKGKQFFGGDAIGYLDIALGCNLGWIKAAPELSSVELLDATKTPKLAAWAEQFWAQDAVKGVLPDASKFVEFANMIRARKTA